MATVSKTVEFRIQPVQYEEIKISATATVEFDNAAEGGKDDALADLDAIIKDAVRGDLQDAMDVSVNPKSFIHFLSDDRFPDQ